MINQHWIFPENCGLEFPNTTSVPTPYTWTPQTIGAPTGITGAREGCASISDNAGNLLFYTDGTHIWDGAHVQQFSGLEGNPSSTQSSIIVPDPADADQYYIFTTDGASHANPPWNHFNGVRVNINSLSTPTPIFPNILPQPDNTDFSPVEKLTAIQHANCRDYWVITIVQDGNDGTTPGTAVKDSTGVFRVFLVSSTGVSHVGDTSLPSTIKISEGGYMKGSPNGKFLALANGGNQNVLVYPFDNSNGTIDISAQMNIQAPAGTSGSMYGVEFSPDSNLLYYSSLILRTTGSPGLVWQVDFQNSLNSLEVGSISTNASAGRYQIGALQLGINGVIYIAKDGDNSLGAILDPNTLGLGCNVSNSAINLPRGVVGQLGLPNLLPNPCEDHDCGCGCKGCNREADLQNEELFDRAKSKFNLIPSGSNCPVPIPDDCTREAIPNRGDMEPCFYFHWGDGTNDQIEEHDTEVFYLTICNSFSDIQYNGLRITKVTLVPDIHPIDKIQIVPDRFVSLDCLEPCSCQTREFAILTRANDTAGNYSLEVEYCYESISIQASGRSASVKFPVEITED